MLFPSGKWTVIDLVMHVSAERPQEFPDNSVIDSAIAEALFGFDWTQANGHIRVQNSKQCGRKAYIPYRL
jgi:hypothetical protein